MKLIKKLYIKFKIYNNYLILFLTYTLFIHAPHSVLGAEIKPPSMITIMAYELGSSGHMAYGYIGEYAIKKYGLKIRVIPAGNDTARMIALRSGIAQFAGQGLDAHYAMEGITPRYSTRDWGPQENLRFVWMAQHPGQAFVVRGTSKIYSVAELKGKKVAWIPGSALNDLAEAHLAYAGLSWNDVIKVNVPGYIPSIKAVIDGTVDAALGMVTTSTLYELEASPYGIRWLPENDEEGIKRIRKKVSDLVPFKATIGAGISENKPLDCCTYAYPATICYANLEENIAYFLTKLIYEGYESMSKSSEMMKHYWKLDTFLYLYENYDFPILHNGTVKYLKEIGKWKSIYEKFQKERIEYFKKLKSLWDDVCEEALENKIADKDFPEFWLKKRAKFISEKK